MTVQSIDPLIISFLDPPFHRLEVGLLHEVYIGTNYAAYTPIASLSRGYLLLTGFIREMANAKIEELVLEECMVTEYIIRLYIQLKDDKIPQNSSKKT